MKIQLEHRLPKKLRYAKVYFEAGTTSVSFSLDGASADWHASIGRKSRGVELSDKEYSRFRSGVPAKDVVEDDGNLVVISNSDGYEEEWVKPRWVLTGFRKSRKPRVKEERS